MPTANTQTGTLQVVFTGGVVQDGVGNKSSSSNTLTWNYDTLAPTLSMTQNTSGAMLSGAILITVTASEPLQGVQTGSLSASGGTISNMTLSGNTWTYRVVPTNNTQTGTLSLSFGNTSIRDIAGNSLTQTLQDVWSYDTHAPEASARVWTASGDTDTGFSASYQWTFDEGVTSTLKVFSGANSILVRTQSGTLFQNAVYNLDGGRTYTYTIDTIDRV